MLGSMRGAVVAGMALVAWAAMPVHATMPASLIIHKNLISPWTIAVDNNPNNVGKVKIFATRPQFDDDGNLINKNEVSAQLRSAGESFTLDRTATSKRYWIVFYPDKCRINLTLNVYQKGVDTVSASKVTVQQIVLDSNYIKNGIKVVSTLANFEFLGSLLSRVAKGGAIPIVCKVNDTTKSHTGANCTNFACCAGQEETETDRQAFLTLN